MNRISRVVFLSRFGRVAMSVLLSLALINAASTAQTGKDQTKTPGATFTLLYSFTGGSDGYSPQGRLVFDDHGALLGTTFFGGTFNNACNVGCGTVFRLARTNRHWKLETIHSFAGYPNDVGHSSAHVTFDNSGNLYGTAGDGGLNLCFAGFPCGGIFKLSPSGGGGWGESVIYNFTKHSGESPIAGLMLYKGVLYGTTPFGPESKGDVGHGTVFTLALEKGAWMHKIIHAFAGRIDGYETQRDLIFDNDGNAYGSTPYGGTSQFGDIFELVPNGKGGWEEKLLYSFPSNYLGGANPSTLISDSGGNLYGVTSSGGTGCQPSGCGTVFELKHSKTGWRQIILYEFAGGSDGYSPYAGLVFDNAGGLYGTTFFGGTGTCRFDEFLGCGTVFKLTRATDGKWHKTTLYNFAGANDGEFPSDGTLTLDNVGRLYGATVGSASIGAGSGYGTVYRITP
jgi:uncharacterized repeat protein (TIGR03803 family)